MQERHDDESRRALSFFDDLYHGYTGEYQLVSALYRNDLDAVRPPADMGIDVVSLNLKAQLENPATPPETLFFQVKTRLADFDDDRRFATVKIELKDNEIELICEDKKRALVCYVYTHDNEAPISAYEAPFCCFWIDGERLGAIRRNGGLFKPEGEAKHAMLCRLTQSAVGSGNWYIAVINESYQQVDEGYLGTADMPASDNADHYSIRGFLEYVRR